MNQVYPHMPAFPRPIGVLTAEEYNTEQEGMQLRTWLAGLALQGLLSWGVDALAHVCGPEVHEERVGALAVAYADGLLRALACKGGQA